MLTIDRDSPSFELTFRPRVELIPIVRRFVSSLYGRVLGDPDASSRVALATHELLDNANRYSADGVTTLRIEVSPEVGEAVPSPLSPADVRIRIWNRTERAHVESLRERFAEMDRFPDPFAYYLHRMAESARRKDGGSGLGLARLKAEAEMRLSFELEGDRVCIVADTSPRSKEALS
jgi:anti-sigma regulatory factor (Ser/Thr protein kinase)